MLRILWTSLLMVLAVYSPTTVSAEKTTNSEYAGIEITVNVNTAEAAELAALLTGVGAKKLRLLFNIGTKTVPF